MGQVQPRGQSLPQGSFSAAFRPCNDPVLMIHLYNVKITLNGQKSIKDEQKTNNLQTPFEKERHRSKVDEYKIQPSAFPSRHQNDGGPQGEGGDKGVQQWKGGTGISFQKDSCKDTND